MKFVCDSPVMDEGKLCCVVSFEPGDTIPVNAILIDGEWHVPVSEDVAACLTKGMDPEKTAKMRERLGMAEKTENVTEEEDVAKAVKKPRKAKS